MQKRIETAAMLDWDHLRSFLAIARAGSLTGAAKTLAVRQSTMGRRLEALETAAGARLFTKTPGGFVLTPAGEAIQSHVERMEAEALAAERLITGQDIRLEGRVRVTSIETMAVDILVPICAEFQQRYPGIELEFSTDTRSLSLTRREADIAIRLSRPTQHDVAVRRVGTMAFGLFASPAYLETHGRPDFAGAGAGHRIVTTEEDLLGLPDMRWFTALMPRAAVALRSNTRFLHRNAVMAGMGIGCLARYVGDAAPDLVRLPPPEGTACPAREIWLAMHNDIRDTPRIRALADHLSAGLRQAAPMLAPAD